MPCAPLKLSSGRWAPTAVNVIFGHGLALAAVVCLHHPQAGPVVCNTAQELGDAPTPYDEYSSLGDELRRRREYRELGEKGIVVMLAKRMKPVQASRRSPVPLPQAYLVLPPPLFQAASMKSSQALKQWSGLAAPDSAQRYLISVWIAANGTW